jgi:hypothetical protein
MFKRSVSLFFLVEALGPFFLLEIYCLRSFTVSLFFTILSAAASASFGSSEANNFAWPFSICPEERRSKTLLEVIVVLLS